MCTVTVTAATPASPQLCLECPSALRDLECTNIDPGAGGSDRQAHRGSVGHNVGIHGHTTVGYPISIKLWYNGYFPIRNVKPSNEKQ